MPASALHATARCGTILLLALLPALARAEPLAIENGSLRVTCDSSTGRFTVSTLAPGRTFVSSLRLPISGVATVRAPFDNGEAITIQNSNGSSAVVFVTPRRPFILISEAVRNTGAEDQSVNKLPVASMDLQFDQARSKLTVRGTGGLHAADEYAHGLYQWWEGIWGKITRSPFVEPSGSYEWLAVADPQSRNGVVAGFVGHERATGVLTPSYGSGTVSIEARNEYGGYLLKPAQALQTETFAVGYFDDVRLGLEQYADFVAQANNVKLPPQPSGYCTWYADQHGKSSDEKSLAELSDFIARNLKSYGMSFVQIDDGWQLGETRDDGPNSPNKNFTNFNPHGPYPSGMKATADHIKADGLTPGLWFMPFSGTFDDPWFADKQNLFVKTKDGKPFNTLWGGTCLDMTNPAARDYLKGIVNNIVHQWGFTYLKMDGLHAGLSAEQAYINSDYFDDNWGKGVLADPSKTYVEAFRSGLKLVRDTAGPNVFLLGCNTAQSMRVYGASMGVVDALRIGPDNDGDWKSWVAASPVYGSRHYFLNGRVWYNDPDPCYVRASVSLDEARTMASWTAISGQLYANSDWLPGLPAERLDIIKRTCAPHGQIARPVDFLENDPPRVWQVEDDGPTMGQIGGLVEGTRRDVVALFNWTDHDLKVDVPLAKLDLPPKVDRFAAFDFWANQFLPDVTDKVSETLPPHACRIIALRALGDRPGVLSTSAHVTQGMTDLLEEHWNAATKTLSGESRVVAGDPYELRIATREDSDLKKWRSFEAIPADPNISASTITNITQDNEHRAGFTSTVDGDVSWKIQW